MGITIPRPSKYLISSPPDGSRAPAISVPVPRAQDSTCNAAEAARQRIDRQATGGILRLTPPPPRSPSSMFETHGGERMLVSSSSFVRAFSAPVTQREWQSVPPTRMTRICRIGKKGDFIVAISPTQNPVTVYKVEKAALIGASQYFRNLCAQPASAGSCTVAVRHDFVAPPEIFELLFDYLDLLHIESKQSGVSQVPTFLALCCTTIPLSMCLTELALMLQIPALVTAMQHHLVTLLKREVAEARPVGRKRKRAGLKT